MIKVPRGVLDIKNLILIYNYNQPNFWYFIKYNLSLFNFFELEHVEYIRLDIIFLLKIIDIHGLSILIFLFFNTLKTYRIVTIRARVVTIRAR
jgi:hypothetical protein